MSKVKTQSAITTAVLAVFACGNCISAIDGALSKIADAFGVSSSTALLVGSIAALIACISSIVVGTFAGKKVSYRTMAIWGISLEIVGGLLPYFVHSFALFLVLRCIFGIGLGIIMCIQNPVATKLISDDHRARVLGTGTFVGFAVACIMQLVGGVLADVQWNYVFFTHAILIIALILVLACMPRMEISTSESPKEEKKGKITIPGTAIVLTVMMFIVGMTIAPLLLGSAFYVKRITDSATVAAVVAMMFSIGCMLGGLLYATFDKVFRSKIYTVDFLLGALGVFLASIAKNIPLMCVGFLLGGICMADIMASNMKIVGDVCDENSIGVASALLMSAINLGVFICTPWENLIGKITGDTLYMPLYIAAVLYAVLAVVFLFWSPAGKAKAGETAEGK